MRQLCSRNILFSITYSHLVKILVKEYTRSLIHLLRQLNDTVSTLPPPLLQEMLQLINVSTTVLLSSWENFCKDFLKKLSTEEKPEAF